MNAQDCTTACNTLTTNIGRMKDGKPCYIAGNGNCRQTGRGGKKSSLVCMQKGNLGILLGNNTNPYYYLYYNKNNLFSHFGCSC